MKGVSFVISKYLPLQITDSIVDEDGRYIFLKCSHWDKPLILANIYSPNKSQVAFFRKIAWTLSAFQSGLLIMGGDFNVALNPLEDTSTETSYILYRALKQIKLQIQDLLLHNSWRTLHPDTKD